MQKRAFESIPVPGLSEKPRDKGCTVISEEFLGLMGQKDMLEHAGDYLDLAKIGVGASRLLSLTHLQKKIKLYHQYQVDTFPGGQFLEYAHYHNYSKEYFKHCLEAGFKTVEVSDNMIPYKDMTRERLIKTAIHDYGLRVLGEVGSKMESTDTKKLLSDIKVCLAAGAWKVFMEAADIFHNGECREEMIAEIIGEVSIDKLIFELPGPWIAGVHHYQVESLINWLVEYLGPEVNVANVMPENIIGLQTCRSQIGVTACQDAQKKGIKIL